MPTNALSVVSELAASQHNVFTRRQAASRGITRKQLHRLIESGVIVAIESGGLVVLPEQGRPSWHQRVIGAVLDHPGTVASHTTAARLDGVDGFEVIDDIELSVLRPRVVRIPGVTVHRVTQLDACDIVRWGPIRCTNRARTLCDLGASTEPLMVERALDDAVRRGASVRWIRSTADRLHGPGRPGTRHLLAALGRLEGGGRVRDSWFEKLVELCLDDPTIGHFERQYELRDDRGRHVARFDLAVPEVKLGIEAHSREHHFGEEARMSDEHRDQAAAELGWDVMYLGYGAIRSPDAVRERVRARVEARCRLMHPGGA